MRGRLPEQVERAGQVHLGRGNRIRPEGRGENRSEVNDRSNRMGLKYVDDLVIISDIAACNPLIGVGTDVRC